MLIIDPRTVTCALGFLVLFLVFITRARRDAVTWLLFIAGVVVLVWLYNNWAVVGNAGAAIMLPSTHIQATPIPVTPSPVAHTVHVVIVPTHVTHAVSTKPVAPVSSGIPLLATVGDTLLGASICGVIFVCIIALVRTSFHRKRDTRAALRELLDHM